MFQRQIDVYRLDPNTTYVFKIWASNELGPGEETVLEATTLHDIEEIGKHCVLLQSFWSITHSPCPVFSAEQEQHLEWNLVFLIFSCDLDLILDSGLQENYLTNFCVRNKIMGTDGRQYTKQWQRVLLEVALSNQWFSHITGTCRSFVSSYSMSCCCAKYYETGLLET